MGVTNSAKAPPMLQNQIHERPSQAASSAVVEHAPAPPVLQERRGALRLPVIKSAKIVTSADGGQSVYNCLVLDESAAGVLVDLGAMFSLPEEMTLHMTGGATYRARRCWAVGTKAGLAFIGPQTMSGETAEKLAQLGGMLRAQGLPATLAALRSQRFFENEEVRRAAEAAEAAYLRLEAVLAG